MVPNAKISNVESWAMWSLARERSGSTGYDGKLLRVCSFVVNMTL